MARPRSEEKRSDVLEAAVVVIAEQGAAATTGSIAKRANVSHGSVFHYFATKADLVNATYVFLKEELHAETERDLPRDARPVVQMKHLWVRWMHWGTSDPFRRRALERLAHEDVITPASRQRSRQAAAEGIRIVQAVASKGVFRDQPIEFIGRFFEALATSTMEGMLAEPEREAEICELSFQALVKAIS